MPLGSNRHDFWTGKLPLLLPRNIWRKKKNIWRNQTSFNVKLTKYTLNYVKGQVLVYTFPRWRSTGEYSLKTYIAISMFHLVDLKPWISVPVHYIIAPNFSLQFKWFKKFKSSKFGRLTQFSRTIWLSYPVELLTCIFLLQVCCYQIYDKLPRMAKMKNTMLKCL